MCRQPSYVKTRSFSYEKLVNIHLIFRSHVTETFKVKGEAFSLLKLRSLALVRFFIEPSQAISFTPLGILFLLLYLSLFFIFLFSDELITFRQKIPVRKRGNKKSQVERKRRPISFLIPLSTFFCQFFFPGKIKRSEKRLRQSEVSFEGWVRCFF